MNKKVKNAQKNFYKGIKYRSKLECDAAKCFEEAHIDFQYEPFRIVLIPSFDYLGKHYIHMTYKPDFVIFDNILIEMKGYPTQAWILKRKILLKHIIDTDYEFEFHEVRSISELKELINIIKENEKTK